MVELFNVYCDENCHLEHDKHKVMVLGAIWCHATSTRAIHQDIRQIKADHGLSKQFEIKWVKVSPAKTTFYLELIDYFFNNDDLHFRALIANKSTLDHKAYRQTHDDWYYKMYFDLLRVILAPSDRYRIYFDIKDTWGARKTRKLQEYLSNDKYDFDRKIIERTQIVRSDEIGLMQIADLFIGAVSYVNRGLDTSPSKLALIQRLKERSGYSLTRTTLLRETKMNIFQWRASDPEL